MDVRCSSCGVEYEFDETKVKPGGVTVKCTSCGHVFKVARPGDTTSPPQGPPPSSDWTVRAADGNTYRFKELTTLQKWIVEQKVSRDDTISKTGKTWKRLGDIAELASFFQVVDAAKAASQLSNPPLMSEPPGPLHDPSVSMPVAAQSLQATPPQATLSNETFFDPGAMGGASGGQFDLDDDDPVLAWKRRARTRKIVFALVVLVLAGVPAGLYVGDRPLFDKLKGEVLALADMELEAPVSFSDDDLMRALRSDSELLVEDGLKTLAGPLEGDPDADLVAAAARLEAARARMRAEAARLATLSGDAEGAARQTAGRDSALGRAYALATRAIASSSSSPSPHLANAAYQALKGAMAEMESDLEAAIGKAGGDASVQTEANVLRALAEAQVALSSKDKARAQTALEKVEATRAKASGDRRLAYAALALRAVGVGKDDKAALVDEIRGFIQSGPRSERATMLASVLDGGKKKPADRAADKPADKSPPKPDEKPKADDDDDDKGGGKRQALGYSALLSRGDRARISDRTDAAVGYYKRAIAENPGGAQAYAGLGWCHLDLEKPRAALDDFEKAIARDGDLAEAHFGLALALEQAGKGSRALSAYKRYLELAPGGDDAPDARRAVKRLGG